MKEPNDGNKLLFLGMESVRAEVLKHFPFLEGRCDIDIALAYEAIVRTPNESGRGFRISFPKRPQASFSGKLEPPFPAHSPAPTGVLVGTLKSRRIKASRSQVRFNYLYLTT